MTSTSSLYDYVVAHFRRALKKKDWDGRVVIRMGFGKRGKNKPAITEDDLVEDQFLFSQTLLESPAIKTSAKEKRIESNMYPLEVLSFFRKVYFDNNPNNRYFYGLMVQMINHSEHAVISTRGVGPIVKLAKKLCHHMYGIKRVS